jgi:hypothetical protein
MAITSLSEFGSVAKTNYGANPVDCLGSPTAAQDVTIPSGATANTATLAPATGFVRIFAGGDCQIAVGGTVYERFPAGTIEVRQVAPNSVLSVKAY